MGVMEMFRLDGKVALVTGGARHLGYDMAEALAEAGADLAITSRSLESARQAAEKLRADWKREVLPLALNQLDRQNITEVVQSAHAWKGRIDILINNAGGSAGKGPAHLFGRLAEDAQDLIQNNVLGTLFCCQEVGQIMARQGHGKIINIGSIAGIVGRDRRIYERNRMNGQPIDYAAAKGAVIAMTRDLAGLLSPMGVHVNCISPGGFARNQPNNFEKDYSDLTPLGRMGRDGIDLKGAALFLASAASDYVTGHDLVVDGGFSIWK